MTTVTTKEPTKKIGAHEMEAFEDITVVRNDLSPQEVRVDVNKVQELQGRIDKILTGKAGTKKGFVSSENDRLFAIFNPTDKDRAGALAALCKKITEEDGGLEGLEHSIDELYDSLGELPIGMVEYATKIFLTHSPTARKYLRIIGLEERQPRMIQPSSAPQ